MIISVDSILSMGYWMNAMNTTFEYKGRKCRVRTYWDHGLSETRYAGYIGRTRIKDLGIGFPLPGKCEAKIKRIIDLSEAFKHLIDADEGK